MNVQLFIPCFVDQLFPDTAFNVVKVLGFFIDEMQGNDVAGYITTYPSEAFAGMGGVPGNNFVVSVALVR